jgi:hypothetical protein
MSSVGDNSKNSGSQENTAFALILLLATNSPAIERKKFELYDGTSPVKGFTGLFGPGH